MSTELATTNGAALAAASDMPAQVYQLFERALAQGESGVNALKELVALQDSMQRRRAELEFSVALAAFQESCPPVTKSSTAKITTGGGGGYSFTYADYEEIVTTVRPHLAAHGFSFTFNSSVQGDMLTCVCKLRHSMGHHETAEFTLPTENKSGPSAQQKVGGALTYAKRQCLISVLGLALTEGETPAPVRPVETVNEEQRATLLALLDETKTAPARFCDYFKVGSVAELPVTRYQQAVAMLEKKRKGDDL